MVPGHAPGVPRGRGEVSPEFEISGAELDAVIEQLHEQSSTQVFRVSDRAVMGRMEPVRYLLYFRGVLMARCVTMSSALRLKRVLLAR